MNLEIFRNYCLQKTGVSEEFPFDRDTLVFKVMGKIFALTDVVLFESVNLKCDPEKAVELRERYSCVLPGYHMNKRHWNTVVLDGSVPDSLIFSWLDDSYNLVVENLPKRSRKALKSEMKER